MFDFNGEKLDIPADAKALFKGFKIGGLSISHNMVRANSPAASCSVWGLGCGGSWARSRAPCGASDVRIAAAASSLARAVERWGVRARGRRPLWPHRRNRAVGRSGVRAC